MLKAQLPNRISPMQSLFNIQKHFYSNYSKYSMFRQRLPSNYFFIKFVPHQEAWIVERFGKFHKVLDSGMNILIPFVDRVKYVNSLKELAIEVPSQTAVTQDNVTVSMDGVLFFRILDPFKASYGIDDYGFAITQLAQTTMRAEIGLLSLDRIFAERAQLNARIVSAINDSTAVWGIECMRYEIRDIHMPESIIQAMQSQSTAERKKRAMILESEGLRQKEINEAEGKRQSLILSSEALRQEEINKATGESQAIKMKAEAIAESIKKVSEAIESPNGAAAVSMIVAEKYVDAFAKIAQESTTVLIPSNPSDISGMVSQAMTIMNRLGKEKDEVPRLPEKKIATLS